MLKLQNNQKGVVSIIFHLVMAVLVAGLLLSVSTGPILDEINSLFDEYRDYIGEDRHIEVEDRETFVSAAAFVHDRAIDCDDVQSQNEDGGYPGLEGTAFTDEPDCAGVPGTIAAYLRNLDFAPGETGDAMEGHNSRIYFTISEDNAPSTGLNFYASTASTGSGYTDGEDNEFQFRSVSDQAYEDTVHNSCPSASPGRYGFEAAMTVTKNAWEAIEEEADDDDGLFGSITGFIGDVWDGGTDLIGTVTSETSGAVCTGVVSGACSTASDTVDKAAETVGDAADTVIEEVAGLASVIEDATEFILQTTVGDRGYYNFYFSSSGIPGDRIDGHTWMSDEWMSADSGFYCVPGVDEDHIPTDIGSSTAQYLDEMLWEARASFLGTSAADSMEGTPWGQWGNTRHDYVDVTLCPGDEGYIQVNKEDPLNDGSASSDQHVFPHIEITDLGDDCT